MSTPTQSDQDLSRREEMTVASTAMSGAPWAAATVTGGVVAVGDLSLHLIGAGLGLGAVGGSLSMGAVAFFVVARGGGAAEPCHPLGQEQSVALRRHAHARVRRYRPRAFRGHRGRHHPSGT